jgi:hypothetical protein
MNIFILNPYNVHCASLIILLLYKNNYFLRSIEYDRKKIHQNSWGPFINQLHVDDLDVIFLYA